MNNHRDVLVDMVREKGWKKGAELGLASGQTLRMLLENFPDLSMIGVDRSINLHRREQVRAIRDQYADRCVVHETLTGYAAAEVEDHSLDFVFIDADHRFDAVVRDIHLWSKKVKVGGTLCGHDYNKEVWPGVVKAVDNYFGDRVAIHPFTVWSVQL